MDPNMTSYLIYAGVLAAGYVLRYIHARQAASSPAPSLQPGVIMPLPSSPEQLTLGHGLLIALIANAVKSSMAAAPVPGFPSMPMPSPIAPAMPTSPASPPAVDLNSLFSLILQALQAQPAPASIPATPAAPVVAPVR
jgi:hypothetical protein